MNVFVWNMSGELTNRWLGLLDKDAAWRELTWDKPQSISHAQLTFDTGFDRELTLTSGDSHNKNMTRAPQPEMGRDDERIGTTRDGQSVTLATVKSNHQRLRRYDFNVVELKSLRLNVTATNGSEQDRVSEVRCDTERQASDTPRRSGKKRLVFSVARSRLCVAVLRSSRRHDRAKS